MNSVKLSILIPAIPSRFLKAQKLYDKIHTLCQGKDIEVLMLMDNKKRSIGYKREALKNQSIGDYFMFVDDDDDLLSVDEIYQAAQQETVDVITFKQKCRNNDGSDFVVNFSIHNKEVETTNDGKGRYLDMNRPPFHVCAWNKKFKKYSYPDVSYGEDWAWVQKALANAKTEIHIDKVLHSYNFDPNITEASTESNAVWTNPNQPSQLAMAESNRRAICNLITPIPRYVNGQQRLFDSLLKINESSQSHQFEIYTDIGEESVGAPPHSENPYAFKVYAMRKLRDMGYEQVFWFDASIVAVKDLSPLWERLAKNGVFMEEAGHWAGTWCNEQTLKYFQITRDQAMKIPMFAAGYIGIDFRTTIGQEFFAHWNEAMLNGCFKGSWQDHRHDMTCASIIAHKLGITHLYGKGGEFFSYVGQGYQAPSPTSVCHLIGL